MNDNFDFRSLRKHVERCDRFDGKFLLQILQIARQRWRIARHVNQCLGREIHYCRANSFAESRRGWIDDQCHGTMAFQPSLLVISPSTSPAIYVSFSLAFFFAAAIANLSQSIPITRSNL